jgi:hypothetical protein
MEAIMKKNAIFSILFLMLFISLLITAPTAFCETSQAGETANTDQDEREYSEKVKDKDPFQALITPPPSVVAPEPVKDDIKLKHSTPVIEPLPIKVTFIVGSSHRKFATLCLNNKVYQMTNGDEEKSGLFQVIEVRDNEVKIFDARVHKERTIKLSGE